MVNLLARKAVLSQVVVSIWTARRHERDVTDEIMQAKGASLDQGHFTKRLLTKQAMKDLKTIQYQARKFHWTHTMPWWEDGTRILPATLILEYTKEMKRFTNSFDKSIDEFIIKYPQWIKEAKKELGKLFDGEDYPEPELLRSKFGFVTRISNIPDSADFRVSLDDALLKQIKNSLDKNVANHYRDMMVDTGHRIMEVVKHMAARLHEYTPNNKGKRAENTFRDSLVDNVRTLADLLPAFNLNEDPSITKLHKRIMSELCSSNAKELRTDANVRKQVRMSAEQILKEVEQFLA